MDKAMKIMISDITLRQNCALIKGSDEIFAFFHATTYCMNILQLKHDRIITVSNFAKVTLYYLLREQDRVTISNV